MNQNYTQVPEIITGKDLDYLSDMFSWNYGCLKNMNQSIKSVNDQQIKELLSRASILFDNNLNQILSILQGGSNE